MRRMITSEKQQILGKMKLTEEGISIGDLLIEEGEDGPVIRTTNTELDIQAYNLQLKDDQGSTLIIVFEGNLITNLPTTDPHLTGALWNDSGVVKVSAGA